MCAIAGIFSYHSVAPPASLDELVQIRDHMTARGPDGCGEWTSTDRRIALAHRRLAIIDLSQAAAQPMQSEDGCCVVSFNGEIYNYRSIRSRLERKGYSFRTQSDTEVLLQLYAESGQDMVYELQGMFAFALWDYSKQALFLARDPYGIKPLYYADDGWTFRFASQVKALIAGGHVSKTIDPAGVVGFYTLGSVPEPFTIYSDIRALPAGDFLWVDDLGASSPQKFFSLSEQFARAESQATPLDDMERGIEVRNAVLDSVRAHLVADVPVGLFLSAGIDSGVLTALAREVQGGSELITVTLGYDEYRGTHDDETNLAQTVARRFATRHTTRIVTEREFADDLPRVLDAMDQPSIDGINTWFVSKAASEQGLKVALSGVGGDELFAGYSSFPEIARWVRLFSAPGRVPLLGRLIRQLAKHMCWPRSRLSPKAASMLEYGGTYAGSYLLRRGIFMPWELSEVLDDEFLTRGLQRLNLLRHIDAQGIASLKTPYAKIATLESSLYMRNQLLRDCDWASMAHSVEVRTPLVDSTLLSRLAPVLVASNSLSQKALLAGAACDALPGEVLRRSKTGFTLPMRNWLASVYTTKRNGETAANCRPAHWSREWTRTLLPFSTVHSNTA